MSEPAGATTELRVLIVEDSERDATLLLRALRDSGKGLLWQRVETAEAMRAALASVAWDIIIADYSLPHFSALEALAVLRSTELDLPFIIVSGAIGEEVAVAAMRAGAHDYLMKGHLARLIPAIERELRDAEVRRQRRQAEAERAQEAYISAALARIGRELIALLDMPMICDRLCQLAQEALRCDGCHVVLWREEQGAYIPISACGDADEQWEAVRALKLPKPVVERLLDPAGGDEVWQVRIAEAPDRPLNVFAKRLGLKVLLHMALRRGDELIGFVTANYRRTSNDFTPEQLRLARGIAQLGSLALEHSRMVADLERANRLKSDFLATMSHELRTPLNVIIGYNDLVMDGTFGKINVRQAESLRRVGMQARSLLELITSTLDIGRLEAGQFPLELTEVHLPQLMREIDQETREARGEKPTVQVEWRLSDDLPALWTDAMKLKVALKNVVTNAVKFTAEGSVRVDATRSGGGVEIAVTDTGIGIAEEALPIIFEPFRQVDSSMTRAHNGVGLGLYITRRLMELVGGGVSVESELGRGSCFRLRLPLKPVHES